MCGIFGYSGKEPVDLMRLKMLAVLNQSRGEDSTGVYGNYLEKTNDDATDFVATVDFDSAVEGASLVIGHTRKATMGYKTKENAHPFLVSSENEKKGSLRNSVVGTHNGQLFPTQMEMISKKYGVEIPNVDSEFIYKMMVYHNFDYDKTLSELDGMMALSFVRPEYPDLLYLYRRENRPLHIGFIDGTKVYYSSEAKPLEVIGCNGIEPLDPHKIFVFRNGGLLEVSPVKKSSIQCTTLDQGIQTFLSSASEREKNALGISTVSAKHTTSATDYQRHPAKKHSGKTYETVYHSASGTDGGQSDNFPEGIKLIKDIPMGLYTEEIDIGSADTGQSIGSGNSLNCILIVQLLTTSAEQLPAWIVRARGIVGSETVTTHNGIAIIEIPKDNTYGQVKLDMFNPLQQNVVYSYSIKSVTAGRVVEVALRIPFRGTQEKNKTGETTKTFINPIFKIADFTTKGLENATEFQKFKHLVESTSHIPERVCTNRESLFKNLEVLQTDDPEWKSSMGLQGFSIKGPYNPLQQCKLLSKTTGDRVPVLKLNGVLESEYNKSTDILNMDLYTTATNLDEMASHRAKFETLLNDPDPEGKIDEFIKTIRQADAFFEYLGNYFESRFKELNKEESKITRGSEDNESRRYSLIDE